MVCFIIRLHWFPFNPRFNEIRDILPFCHIPLWEEDRGCATPFGSNSLFTKTTDTEKFTVQRDFSRHCDGGAKGVVKSEGQEGRSEAQASGGAVFGDCPFREMYVDLCAIEESVSREVFCHEDFCK